jgi:hypothetical protein
MSRQLSAQGGRRHHPPPASPFVRYVTEYRQLIEDHYEPARGSPGERADPLIPPPEPNANADNRLACSGDSCALPGKGEADKRLLPCVPRRGSRPPSWSPVGAGGRRALLSARFRRRNREAMGAGLIARHEDRVGAWRCFLVPCARQGSCARSTPPRIPPTTNARDYSLRILFSNTLSHVAPEFVTKGLKPASFLAFRHPTLRWLFVTIPVRARCCG